MLCLHSRTVLPRPINPLFSFNLLSIDISPLHHAHKNISVYSNAGRFSQTNYFVVHIFTKLARQNETEARELASLHGTKRHTKTLNTTGTAYTPTTEGIPQLSTPRQAPLLYPLSVSPKKEKDSKVKAGNYNLGFD